MREPKFPSYMVRHPNKQILRVPRARTQSFACAADYSRLWNAANKIARLPGYMRKKTTTPEPSVLYMANKPWKKRTVRASNEWLPHYVKHNIIENANFRLIAEYLSYLKAQTDSSSCQYGALIGYSAFPEPSNSVAKHVHKTDLNNLELAVANTRADLSICKNISSKESIARCGSDDWRTSHGVDRTLSREGERRRETNYTGLYASDECN